MKNLDSVFAAYMVGWAIFFGFYLTVSRRTDSLRKEVEELSAKLGNNRNQGN